MKILKKGKKPKDSRKVDCNGCGSKLKYASSDIKSDREGLYIICPVCCKFLSVYP